MTEVPPGPPSGNPPLPPPGGYPPPPPPQAGGFAPQGPPGSARPPQKYLVWAIVAVFCCLPLGIVSIVKSTRVPGLWAQGRYVEAHQAADDAKKWAIWSAIAGAVIVVLAFLIYLGLHSAPPS